MQRQEGEIGGLRQQVAVLTTQVGRRRQRLGCLPACLPGVEPGLFPGCAACPAADALTLSPAPPPPPPPPQKGELEERCASLAANISALYNTAKMELQRKDGEIRELRERCACGWGMGSAGRQKQSGWLDASHASSRS